MTLQPHQALALALDPSLVLTAQGLTPDPWQLEFLLDNSQRTLMLCSRGAGKSRTVSALAVHTALFQPRSLTLLVSRAQRQSLELFRYVKQGYNAVGRPIPAVKENETTLELANGSRVVALPGKEGTIRAYQGVGLLVLDEAARVPDDLHASVRPMLAVSKGRFVALTTPFGTRGWFYKEWTHGTTHRKVRIPWQQCPRITADFIDEERRSFGEEWIQQEYETLFTALSGLVYPTLALPAAEGGCVWDVLGATRGRLVGGIDWGWRNPFAAVWGALTEDDVLEIISERYMRETPLHQHATALKRIPGPQMAWYCDPSGPTERAEMRRAGLVVNPGTNDIRAGIAAVNARVRTQRLRISRTNCLNLIAEAQLYRYPTASERAVSGESPIDADNHALSALRYLVSKVDARYMAQLKRRMKGDGAPPEESEADQAEKARERLEETARAVRGIFGRDLWDEDAWQSV
jgi:hypothetical protein